MSDMTQIYHLRPNLSKTVSILLTGSFLSVFFLFCCSFDAEAGIKRRSSRIRKRISSENSVYQKKQNLKNLLNKNNDESIAADAHFELGMLIVLRENEIQGFGPLTNVVVSTYLSMK